MGVSTILGFGIETLENLPEILFYVQVFSIIMFAFIFGKISVKGYRSYIPKWVKLLLIMPLGMVCLLAASFFSQNMVLNDTIGDVIKMGQIDMLAAGIACSVMLFIGLLLISRNLLNTGGIRKAIDYLTRRLERARAQQGKRKTSPAMVAGLAVIVGFFVFSVLNFHGYPDLASKLYNEMGTSPEEINSLLDAMQSLGNNLGGEVPADKISLLKTINASLPVVLPLIQILVHISLATFLFGWIAELGLVTRFPWHYRILVRLGGGFLALFCGIALSPYIVFSDTHIVQSFMEILQFDVIVAGVISSVIIGLGIFLVSVNVYDIKGLENEREKMRKRLERAEEKERKQKSPVFARPSMIAGVLIVAVVVAAAVMGYRSVPDMATVADKALSDMGLSRSEIVSQMKSFMVQAKMFDRITNQTSEVPEGCPKLYNVFIENMDKITQGNVDYTYDESAKEHIEEASGASAVMVFSVDYKGQKITIAVMSNNKLCSATAEKFCECMNISQNILAPSGFNIGI